MLRPARPGESGDSSAAYSPEYEVEDIDALISEAGGCAFLLGYSSGAVLALEAARHLPGKVAVLAMYDPSFIINNGRPPLPGNYVTHLNELVAAGRQGESVKLFMIAAVGMLPEEVASMPDAPIWPWLEQIVHSIPYDGMIMGDTMRGSRSAQAIRKCSTVTTPTLVMDGGDSPAFVQHSVEEIAIILPNGSIDAWPGRPTMYQMMS